jgi:hypothetical protein
MQVKIFQGFSKSPLFKTLTQRTKIEPIQTSATIWFCSSLTLSFDMIESEADLCKEILFWPFECT